MKKKWIILAIIILVMGGILYKTKTGNKVAVEVSKAVIGQISKYVEETGTIKSHSQRIVHANNSGEITIMHVTEGDLVKKDQLLAEINVEKISLEIKALESEIETLKADYKEAVKPADEEKISQAEAKVSNAKIDLDAAKKDLENSKKLYEHGVLSKDAYDEAIKDQTIKENLFHIAENELQLIEKAASQNIKNKYEAQISQLLYKKEVLEKEKKDLFIKSPIDGIITEIFIKNGGYVQPGTDLFEIGKKDDLYVEVDVLASEISQIIEGKPALLESDDLGLKEIKGTVKKVFPKAFSKISDLGIEQKRVRVHTSISELHKLKIGYEVDVKFEIEHRENVLIIPESAVFSIDDEKYVFIAENNKALLRKIQTGLEGEDQVEIVSGLKKGDQVILSPNETLQDGTLITIENH